MYEAFPPWTRNFNEILDFKTAPNVHCKHSVMQPLFIHRTPTDIRTRVKCSILPDNPRKPTKKSFTRKNYKLSFAVFAWPRWKLSRKTQLTGNFFTKIFLGDVCHVDGERTTRLTEREDWTERFGLPPNIPGTRHVAKLTQIIQVWKPKWINK